MKRYVVRYKLTEQSPEKTIKVYADSPDQAEYLSFDLIGVLSFYYVDAVLMKS